MPGRGLSARRCLRTAVMTSCSTRSTRPATQPRQQRRPAFHPSLHHPWTAAVSCRAQVMARRRPAPQLQGRGCVLRLSTFLPPTFQSGAATALPRSRRRRFLLLRPSFPASMIAASTYTAVAGHETDHLFVRSGGKPGSGGSFSTVHNELIISGVNSGSGRNSTCYEDTSRHAEDAFYTSARWPLWAHGKALRPIGFLPPAFQAGAAG
eukprot:SAG31_NODE_1407_length_8482_cov_11.903291_1_plen_208_part_00